MNSEISKYTISVYELQEMGFDFGLNTYTIWNEDYRAILNEAILQFFMFREIGFANPNVWKYKLNARLNLIMRNKYNAMYSAKAKEFNPLYTLDVYEEYSHTVENVNTGEVNFSTNSTNNTTTNNTNNSTSEETTETNNSNLGLTSQFPSEEMTEDDLSSNLFIDSANKGTGTESTTDNVTQNVTGSGTSVATNTGADKTTNTGNTNTTESYNKHSYGSASDLSFAHSMVQFKDYCDQFRIDEQVIEELKDLFITMW
jgi:hypothetical protein